MRLPLLVLFLPLFILSCKTSSHVSSKNNAKTVSSMVVCAHPAAAKAGINVLKQGGNAFDAAIATQFALAVAYPRAGNIGGGGFAVYRHPTGECGTLDFREKAPLTAGPDLFLDNRGKVIPNMSLVGVYASGVPGTVDGMFRLHSEKGSLPWFQLLQPAIDLAEKGVVLTENEALHLNQYGAMIDSVSKTRTAFNIKKWAAGDIFIQKDLATTLKEIRNNGRDGFYKGSVATSIKASMITHYGLISQSDLDEYRAVWRQPVITDYKKYQLIMMPPPSSGGFMISQMLKGVEKLDLTKYPHNSVSYIHGLTELQRRTFADRAEYYGDPDFVDIQSDYLLSDKYAQLRYSEINMQQATKSEADNIKVNSRESFETTHFSIVDKWGNAVAITTTLNDNYGSKLVVSGAGFLLNNEMDDFSIKPGTPNMFGLTGGIANNIGPGKRMLSSMTPTIMTKDGKLFAVLGTPGGSTIINVNLQAILNLADYDMTMQEAVVAPKMHSQWLPDEIYLEKGKFSPEVIKGLEQRGHKIKEIGALGKLDCIKVLSSGNLEGGTDPTKGDGTIEKF